jgi:predicted RecA/RadA family phage recombinase
MKTFLSEGCYPVFTAPIGGVTKDIPVKIGDLLVVPTVNAAAGVKFVGCRCGEFDVDKVDAQAWTEGQQINWDDGAKLFTNVTTGNYRCGVASAAAANPSARGKVLLFGVNLGAALA